MKKKYFKRKIMLSFLNILYNINIKFFQPPSSSEPKATQVSKDNSFEVTSKKQNTEENGIIENEDSVVKVSHYHEQISKM